MIELRRATEIQELGEASKIVAKTLDFPEREVKAGMSLRQIGEMAEKFILSSGAKPSFENLYDFPSAICASLNEVYIYGIADDKVLKDGDILGLGMGTLLDGYYGDAARTLAIGEISKRDKELVACTKDALYFAIDSIRGGMHFKELSTLLGEFIASHDFVPLQGYCGHGVRTEPHYEPEILNYLEEGSNTESGPKIKNGMVFCIEPMICQKGDIPKYYNGRWDTGNVDGLNTAHYEHYVAIVKGRTEILSQI